MKSMKKLIVAAGAFLMSVTAVSAAEVSIDLGADVVSQYVWRGMEQGSGPSIQPGVGINIGDFSLGAWGSTSLVNLTDGAGSKELDFTASYSIKGFGVSFTDYWWSGQGYSFYHEHMGELTLSYEFGEKFPLSIGVSTFVYGDDNDFSTYISLSYPFSVKGVDMGVSVGMSPFGCGQYNADSFAVMDVTLSASKEIKITENYSLPIFGQLIYSPNANDMFFVVGVSF